MRLAACAPGLDFLWLGRVEYPCPFDQDIFHPLDDIVVE